MKIKSFDLAVDTVQKIRRMGDIKHNGGNNMINKDGILEITDGAGDTVKVQISNITGYAYVSVNDDTQVRLLPENVEEFVAYLTPKAEPTQDTYYLLRQRKDNPLKVKVMFANTSDSKHFLSREEANAHQERMTRQHGTTYKFFIVKEVK